jgi:hypothetical protein
MRLYCSRREEDSVSFGCQWTVRCSDTEAREVERLGERMQLPDSAVLRLLVRVGIEAFRRDPSVILGSPDPATR